MKPDFQQINKAALECFETLVREWLPAGKKSGNEWEVGNLSGGEGSSLKVNLTKGVWKDFASDAGGGDPISLLAAIRSISQGDAAREIAGRLAIATPAPASSKDWQPIIAPASAPAPTFRHHKHGEPVKVWRYATDTGDTIGYICRYNTATGKEILPRTYCQQGDRREWRWTAFGKPRPLCGLDLLAADPKAGVLIVEGEPAMDAARGICPGVVVTWPGGSKAVRYANWTPLKGRKVLIWPDADEPGIQAAGEIMRALKGIAASVRIVPIPAGASKGWDLADAVDEGWDRARLIEHIKAMPEPAPEPPPGYDAQEYEGPTPEGQPRFRDDRVSELPFRLLGVEGDEFYYMPDRGQQIVSITAGGHTKNNLMRLAPLNAWEEAFSGSNGVNWDASVNALIQRNQSLPKFDPRRIRGRGCWIDGSDVVFHAGDRLVVNGAESDIPGFNSAVRAIYEGALEIPVDSADHATNREAAKVIELCEMLSWERPLFGKLLAGWLAMAPVCGALTWRPHLWVTGPSGSGKSWTVANIIQPLVGMTAIHVQGNTSEAGIRGMLGSDALPVVFDEAESEDRASQIRFDRVLELARQASTETGAGIVKGTATGGSVTYLVRSMFLFASIGVAAVKKADVSRVTVLPLRKNTGPFAQAEFAAVKNLWAETIAQKSYCERIRSRSLQFAKILRANCETFSQVAVEFTGDKRSADQIGTLLAGAFSLTSTKEITPEAAKEWMSKQDWTGFQSDDVDNDENQCFAHLFSAILRYEADGRGASRSVDEIIREIKAIPDHAADAELGRRRELKDVLIRHGLRLSDGRLYVANRHAQLERVFADTPWAGAKWRQQLERMPGGMKHEVTSFGANVRQRAVSVGVG
jgi:putative DNA primase/helicase